MEELLKEKDDKISILEEQIKTLRERLSKYTNPSRQKKYYNDHKEKIITQNTIHAKLKKKNKNEL